jgi:hypothetical protein
VAQVRIAVTRQKCTRDGREWARRKNQLNCTKSTKSDKKASEWIFISCCNGAVQRRTFDKIQQIALVSDMTKIM